MNDVTCDGVVDVHAAKVTLAPDWLRDRFVQVGEKIGGR
jgi:UDP-N-acetyl-D-mannosaminuronic acid transferase (WecB/TagA/CpsF family)